jgi:endonuclease/exonuclease/phosphatase family metal-dependent hydrolase
VASTLTVMSFNIHQGRDVGGTLDLDRTAAVVRAQDADLVALQEVGRHWSADSAFRDQAADLAALLDMDAVFAANLDRDPPAPGSPRRQYGTAILSSRPLLASEHVLLPRASEESEQRGMQVVDVDLDGAPLRLHNTHLGVSVQDRELQVAAILAEAAGASGPHALLGDFNARPSAPDLAPLFDRLRDAWALAGDGDGFTFPVPVATARIDYVLVSPELSVAGVRIPPLTGSDHFPLVADLTLAG